MAMRKITYYVFLFIISCHFLKSQVPIEADTLDWLPKREDVRAGAILVPENHNNPDGNKIQITYIVIKAKEKSTTKHPLIYFMGGPGGSTLNEGEVSSWIDWEIGNDRDIILFDQRGTGLSSALPNMSMSSFNIMAKDADEKEEFILMKELIAEYQNKCKALNMHPEFYNSTQNAKDVGMLFKHLGYEKYNIFGSSYGTRLGRVVQDLFPEYIKSSVLMAPSPRTVDFLFDRLDSYTLALQRIFDYCNNDPECKNKYPNLKDDYVKAMSLLKENPLTVKVNDSVNVVINVQDGIYLLRRLLYTNNSRESAPELIHAFINGSSKPIEAILQFELQITDILNLSMLLSVEKYENFNSMNSSKEIDKYYLNNPLLPSKLGFFDAFYQAGMIWHNANLPMNKREFQNSDIPTLIFVNQYDPVTPPKYGHLFKKKLNNGTLLILNEGGHGGGDRECRDKVIYDFMNNPNETLDTSCLNIYNK